MLFIISRTIIVWIIIIAAEVLHGIVRLRFLAVRLGDRRSRQLGVCTGSIINFLIIALCIRWIGATTPMELLGSGLALCALTIAFDVLFGRYVAQYPWKRIIADFDFQQGGWLAFGLIAMMLSPLIADRITRML